MDKIYTNTDVAQMCVHAISSAVHIDRENDVVIEPSAGGGAFIGAIRDIVKNCEFYDIEPEHPDVVKQDYLQFTYDYERFKKYRKVHVIGSPPFGNKHDMLKMFIHKSCTYTDTVAFILPKSLITKKICYFPDSFELINTIELPENSFTECKAVHHVECIFQTWKKK